MGSRERAEGRGERPEGVLESAVRAAVEGSVGLRVGLVHPSGSYRRGLSAALRQMGLDVDEVSDPVGWVGEGNGDRVVVCAVRSDGDRELVGRLAPRVRVVALVPPGGEAEFAAALRVGAVGVVDMDRSPEWIAGVVGAAVAGFVVVPHAVAVRLAGAEVRPAVALSAEETLLVRRLADGATLRTLAGELCVNEWTVRRRLDAVYGKLGVSSRTECLAVAGRLGVI